MIWLFRWYISRPILFIGSIYFINNLSIHSFMILIALVVCNYLINEIGRVKHGINLIIDSSKKLNELIKNHNITPIEISNFDELFSPTGLLEISNRYKYLTQAKGKKEKYFLQGKT